MPKQALGTLIAAVTMIFAAATGSWAQDYVGVLPEILKPEVSTKLALTDEQKEQVQALIRSRMSAAIGLGQTLREAPTSQHDQLRAEFNAESERLGFELLDADQQRELAKYRLNWLGMLSLGEAEVARSLNLADWQQETIELWLSKVRSDRRGPTAASTRSEAERAIRQEISDSQWAAWQLLAGMIESSPAGAPMPPERKTAPEPTNFALAAAQPNNAEQLADSDNSTKPVEDIRLEMNFNGTPWNDVIKWLAEEADLSLQTDVPLPGSFTYRDRSRNYTVTEAMDTMNATLLNSGYTLFRQGRMLRVIDFEQDQKVSGELIAELADYVDEAGLARRGKYEPVKHMFTLERLEPNQIVQEAEQLRSIQGTIRSLPASRQLLVTDMAGNVRAIGEMIRRAENSGSSTIQMFQLTSVTAEEVLSVARPLLGLAGESNVNDDIRISTNPFGTTIFVSGKSDKIQNLKDLIIRMDMPPSDDESLVESREPLGLQKHRVVGIDMQLAYEIVSQLLAGSPDVRLAQDTVAKQLVLQARPSEHKLVQDTLNSLAGDSSDFVVIQLNRLDPTLAIAAIKKFFSLPDTPSADSGGPVIDGDLLARQVWIKGSTSQVEQIRSLLDKLEENARSNDLFGDTIRMVPLTGTSARQTLEQVQQLWNARNGGANPIRFLTPSVPNRNGNSLPQKTFSPSREAEQPLSPATPSQSNTTQTGERIPGGKLTAFPQQDSSASDLPAELFRSSTGDIVILEGPGGLIISSSDAQALAEFDSLLRLLADQAQLGGSEPTVVYLRNRKASAAKELLETILSGTSSSGSSGGGGLLGDMAGAMLGGLGGGMFGSMLGGGGSDFSSGVGIASGDYTITADPWLNALVIKAGPADMHLIELLLQVIDQPEGPLTIETQGQLAMIPVISQNVTQVLNMIKQLYGERIEGNSSSGGSRGATPGGSGGGQPSPADLIAALRGGGSSGRGGRGGGSELAESKIALSADTNTNMLVVLAQPKQIEELKKLVAEIDRVGELEKEDFGYSSLGGIVSASVFQDSIGRMLGPKAQTNTSPSSTGSGSSSGNNSNNSGGSSSADDAAAQERRAAFFEAMRQRGGFGGTTGGGGPPSGFSGRPSGDSGRGGPPSGFGSGGFGGRGSDSGGRR